MGSRVPSRIYIHRYRLHSRVSLNARSQRRVHEGALIKMHGGYACVHPWPELGDLPLDGQLQALAEGRETALIRQALYCARQDGLARKESRCLFEGLDIPRSHASSFLDGHQVAQAAKAGYDTVKVKMGRDLSSELAVMQEIAGEFPSLRWRVDLNHCRTYQEVIAWLGLWPAECLERLDFIEDAWKPDIEDRPDPGAAPVCLAIDREVERHDTSFPVWILKPAVNDARLSMPIAAEYSRQVVMTSYMDHPLGQSYAAWQAALMGRQFAGVISTCGLMTHGLFEADAFSEALGDPKPEFIPVAGTGLGFDELLESLPWKQLI